MDSARFDRATLAIATTLTRRGIAGALGLTALSLSAMTQAKKKRKKKVKIKLNEFGCVNFGDACKNGGQCCSGICGGKKDKKTCRAHDTSGCQAGIRQESCGGINTFCTTSAGALGICNTTTGNAGYCTIDGECAACARDADCTGLCGPKAACVVCASCTATGNTACVTPVQGGCLGTPPPPP